jgi:hypothetical protein
MIRQHDAHKKNWTDALYTKLHKLGLETVNLHRLSRHLLVRHPQDMRLNDGPAAKKPELPIRLK